MTMTKGVGKRGDIHPQQGGLAELPTWRELGHGVQKSTGTWPLKGSFNFISINTGQMIQSVFHSMK